MEKIILYVLIIGGGLLFEFFKRKMKEKPAAPSSQSDNHRFPPAPSLFDEPGLTIPTPSQTPVQYVSTSTSHFLPGEQVESFTTPKAEKQRQKKAKSKSAPAKSGNTPDSASIIEAHNREEARRAAHYARWRQAIIDAQIIQRKF